jgi:glycosyltransferase involved in cell wall biosynthesis
VDFPGRISEEEKVQLLGRSWVMVQPSFKEGWGITCLEANACGTPVLASRVSGLTDAVKEGVNGYLFDYGDYQQLTRKLLDLIQDNDTRQVLATSSRQWSLSYSWEEQAEKLESLINRVLGSKQMGFVTQKADENYVLRF